MCLFPRSPQLSPFLYMQRLSLPSIPDRREPVDKYPSALILWVGQLWGFPVGSNPGYHSNYLCTLHGLPHFFPLHRVSLGAYPQINYRHSFVWGSVSGRSQQIWERTWQVQGQKAPQDEQEEMGLESGARASSWRALEGGVRACQWEALWRFFSRGSDRTRLGGGV